MTDGGGRKSTATVLFTDLVGSTDIRRAFGDDKADELRRKHDSAILAAAAEHLGEAVKGTGDGLMLVFPAAAEALAGAVAIQRAISRLSRNLPAPITVRVGLSAGDVSWEDEDCFGTPVVEAARLCDAAANGQILASEVVRLLAGSRGGHQLTAAGTFELKGIGAFAAYEVAWETEAGGAPLPAALAPHETLPLIGRVDERGTLNAAWKRSLEGSLQVALIAGEPGVGKTRLAAELARGIHGDDAIVLFGRCDEELGVPYQPFAEALATYAAGCADDVLRAQMGTEAGDLGRLVPALATRFANLPEPMRTDPETERYQLFEAYTAWLANVAGDSPVLLLVDDLHWAARPTLLLLRHLVRHHAVARLMLVVTYRDTDLGRGHPLSEMLADLRREDNVERVVLRGLIAEEVAELVASAMGHELDDDALAFAHAVHAETEGNPFFVGQVLRHLAETGAIVVEDGRWVVTATGALGIPEGVREVIGKRLSQLSNETNEVLSVAAVIGRQFDSKLLTDASGLDADAVLDALEEAEASRLVVPLAGSDAHRTFAHALVRSTLYDEIATTRRLRIHRRVAQALEDRAERGMPCLEDLAHHSCESAALGDVSSAIRWSCAAAEAAFERLAYEESASHYERALAVLDPSDPGHQADLADLRVKLAQAMRAAGMVQQSRATAFAAADAARACDRPEIIVRAALVLSGDRGWGEAGIIDDELVALLEEGLAALPEGDSPWRAMAMARLAGELYFLVAESERRTRLSADAMAMAERVGDDAATAFVLGCAAWGSWLPGRATQRLGMAREIIELSRRSGNHKGLLTGNMWLLNSAAELGDGETFRAALARQGELVDAWRQPEWLWIHGVHRAAAALIEARFDDAQMLADEALAISQQLPADTPMQMYAVATFALCRARGGLEGLLPLLQTMVEQYPLVPSWRSGLAYLYRDLGMVEEAREQFEHFAADDFRDIPRDANWIPGIAILAAVCNTLADTDRAPLLYGMLLPYADGMITAGTPADILGSVHLPLMLLAATMDRWDDAEAHFREAQLGNERMGNRTWIIQSNIEWARVLAHRSDVRARDLLATVVDDSSEAGMTRIAAEAEALLAQLP